MKYQKKRMAHRAMLFVYLLLLPLLAGGCERYSYESVAVRDSFPDSGSEAESEPESTDGISGKVTLIRVYVCGAVRESGVYTLPQGARVCDAVEAAGGLSEEADEISLNQARILSDGEQITVLTKEQAEKSALMAAEGSAADEGRPPDSLRININTAGPEELQKLNGIGAARAADIIAYREEHGGFQKIEDIMKVTGIKSSLFNRIKDGITVG